jgi:xanthine dehydrogenase accessory factor
MRIFSRLVEALDAEGAGALVTVLAAEGSSPRDAGARLVVRPSGGFHGTIGGGTLEWQALADARRALAAGRGAARHLSQSLGPDLGQCCGGRVRLLIETFDAHDRSDLAHLAQCESAGLLETEAVLGEDGRYHRAIVRALPFVGEGHEDEVASMRDGRLREIFGDRSTPLLLFGAGHVGRAVVLALAPLPFTVRWIDSREDGFPAAVPSNVVCVHAALPADELAAAVPGAFVVVMTHSHPLDLEIVAKALRMESLGYVGLIGSATKRSRFVSRLRSAGLAEHEIGRLICPIGLAGLPGKEPPIIAASLAADLLFRRQQAASARQDRPAQRRRG